MGKSLKTRIFARFRQHTIFKRFTRIAGRQITPSKWAFIIGCYNSGTTLLDSILCQHPVISALEDEGAILTGYLNRPEDFGWQRMWCECYKKVRLEAAAENAKLAENIKRHWSHFFSRDPEKVLLEKSIVNTTRIPFFQAFFQPAYFIYLVRNGYAVSEGIRRKARPGAYGNPRFPDRYSIEQCARQWQATHEVVEKDRVHTPHFLTVYYEDLTEKPESTLQRITDFLELPPLPGKLLQQKYQIHGMEAAISNQNAKSLARLHEADFRKIEQVAEAALRFHGYHRVP